MCRIPYLGSLLSLAILGSPAFAESWTHDYTRGFDLYLTGTDQAGLRLACDSDAERKGSVLAVRAAGTDTSAAGEFALRIGSFFFPVASAPELIVLLDQLSPEHREGLSSAFASADQVTVLRDGAELIAVPLGADRPDLCK